MNDLPKMPERPTRPSESESGKRSSTVVVVLGLGLGFLVMIGLSFLVAAMHPVIGVLMLFVFALLGPIAAFHYFVWGRWIGDTIRKEVAEEEAREAQEREEKHSPT